MSTKIENKITPVLKKYGVQGIVYTFDGNGNYTTKIKKRTIKGTYTFNSKEKTITFKPHYGKEYTANVSILSNQMTLVFNADKLIGAAEPPAFDSSLYHQHADEELQRYALRIQTEEVKG